MQRDDLVTPQGFEEWLEAAGEETTHDGPVDLDVADSGCPLDLLHRSPADAGDFNSLSRVCCVHGPNVGIVRRPAIRGTTESVLNWARASGLLRSTVGA